MTHDHDDITADGPVVTVCLGSLPDCDEDCADYVTAERGDDCDDIGVRRPRPFDPRQPFNPRWWTKHEHGHIIEEMGNFGSLFCVACMEPVFSGWGSAVATRLLPTDPCPARVSPDCDGTP